VVRPSPVNVRGESPVVMPVPLVIRCWLVMGFAPFVPMARICPRCPSPNVMEPKCHACEYEADRVPASLASTPLGKSFPPRQLRVHLRSLFPLIHNDTRPRGRATRPATVTTFSPDSPMPSRAMAA
jgi:hypothetical protein